MTSNFQYPYFTNCSLPESICEVQVSFFGSGVGVCNKETQLCECPDGFNGADLWSIWNDCHINTSTWDACEIFFLAFSSFCFLFCLFGFFRLLIKWEIVHWHYEEEDYLQALPLGTNQILSPPIVEAPVAPQPKRRVSSLIPSVQLGELFRAPKTNIKSVQFQQKAAERRRRRNTAGVIVVWLLLAICFLSFFIIRVMYKTRIEEKDCFQLLLLATIVFLVVLGLWLQTAAWFSNLPSLRAFAGMFPAIGNNVLVKYPKALRYFIFVICLFHLLVCFVFLWMLPYVFGMVSRNLITIAFTVLGIEVLLFVLANNAVCSILVKLFSTFDELNQNKGDSSKIPQIGTTKQGYLTRSKQTVGGMIFMTSVSGPGFAIWLLVFAWYDFAFRFCFLYLYCMFCGGLVCALVSTYLFVFRLGSSLDRKQQVVDTVSNLRN